MKDFLIIKYSPEPVAVPITVWYYSLNTDGTEPILHPYIQYDLTAVEYDTYRNVLQLTVLDHVSALPKIILIPKFDSPFCYKVKLNGTVYKFTDPDMYDIRVNNFMTEWELLQV